LLFPIALLTAADGRLRAVAPDLAPCDLTGATEPELLPRLRLAIEDELTRRLLAGEALPDTRNGVPPANGVPAVTGPAPARWLTIHINLDHLTALARHQARHQAGR